MIVALFLAAAFAGLDPTPTPAQEQTFPEIGRVRSVAPPCAVMRDIVIPSWVAAKDADKRFGDIQTGLPKYAETADDEFNRWSVIREMQLSRVDQALSNMMDRSNAISKLLGDSRISKSSPDPQVQTERAALIDLYETQQARISILSEFVQRERKTVMLHGLDDNSAFTGKLGAPTPTPMPGQTRTPWGQPSLNGIGFNDAREMRDWTGQMYAEVRTAEERVAKTFYPIALNCR